MTGKRLHQVVSGWLGLMAMFVVVCSGQQASAQPAKLDKHREDYQKKYDLYRKGIETIISRVEADVLKTGSPDLSSIFRSEQEAFRDGGIPPAIIRTKKYQRHWDDSQGKLVKAQMTFEAGLLDERRKVVIAGDASRIEALDAELKLLRQRWIRSGEPAQDENLIPIADSKKPTTWLFTIADPGLSWAGPDFRGPNWQEGRSGFASERMANISTGTKWDKERIWLRKPINYPRTSPNDIVVLQLRHDEDAEVYVNGSLLMKAAGYNGGYDTYLLESNQKQLFHEGPNVVAVFCRNNGGGQAIDLGLTVYRGASDVVAKLAKAARDPDQFEVGAVWEGPRLHLDTVVPNETYNVEMHIIQRMGGYFLARQVSKSAKGSSTRLVSGTVNGSVLKVEEPTAPARSYKIEGKIDNGVWKYEFRGQGTLGAERVGRGEMKLRQGS